MAGRAGDKAATRRGAARSGKEDPGRAPRDLYEIDRESLVKFEREQQDLQNAVRVVLRPDQQEKFQRFPERRP